VTVGGVFFGFAVDSGTWELAAVSVGPTILFWGLDAYFLYCERLFRKLYDRVRQRDPRIPHMFMAASERGPDDRPVDRFKSWLAASRRPSVAALYLGLITIAILVAASLALVPQASSSPAGQSSASPPVGSPGASTPIAATAQPSAFTPVASPSASPR
jgi:hypothetical protein